MKIEKTDTTNSITFKKYDGHDLQLFNNTNNWFPWQKTIYNSIFTDIGEINTKPREVFWIFDQDGKSGKSSFSKYLYYHHSDKLKILTYTKGLELKTSIINSSPKKLYLIDLSHLNGQTFDKIELLSLIDELKDGFVISSDNSSLLMDRPYIVLFSNFIFQPNSFGAQHWKTFEIENKTLKNIPKHASQGHKIQTQKKMAAAKNEKKLRYLYHIIKSIIQKTLSTLNFSGQTISFSKQLAEFILILLVLDKII